MQPFMLIVIVVFGLVVLSALIVLVIWMRRFNAETRLVGDELHPQGCWIGISISIGAGFGVAFGTALGNIALGFTIGAGAGIAVVAALEQKNKDKLRSSYRRKYSFQSVCL